MPSKLSPDPHQRWVGFHAAVVRIRPTTSGERTAATWWVGKCVRVVKIRPTPECERAAATWWVGKCVRVVKIRPTDVGGWAGAGVGCCVRDPGLGSGHVFGGLGVDLDHFAFVYEERHLDLDSGLEGGWLGATAGSGVALQAGLGLDDFRFDRA